MAVVDMQVEPMTCGIVEQKVVVDQRADVNRGEIQVNFDAPGIKRHRSGVPVPVDIAPNLGRARTEMWCPAGVSKALVLTEPERLT